MANEINQIKVGSTTYTLQDARVDDLVTGVSSVNSKTGDVSLSASDVGALSSSGGNVSGHIYLTGAKESSSTGNTSQIIFGTSSNNHVAVSSNTNALVINPTSSTTTNQIVLYLDKASVFPNGISGNASSATTAANATKLDGQAASYYAKASDIPTVNDATLTIQRNGTNVATFTANASSNATANITVPTTASDVGAAPSASGTYFVNGTQTASTNAWTGTLTGITLYDGLAIRYYLPYAGTSTGATLALNGGTAYPVYRLGTTTQITTHFAAGSVIAMTFRTSYNVAGTTKTNAWICEAFYDSNTNTYQRLYPTTTNAEYPITTRYNTTTGSNYYAEYGRYSTGVTLNPSTNAITATTFKGALDGNASSATTATTATKIGTSTIGSATQPVYINAGTPTACTYTIGKSVPSDAKFTDTTYSEATTSAAGLMSAADKTKLDGTFGANAITDFNMSSGTTTASEINTNGIKCATDELEIEFNGGTDYNYCVGNFTVPIVAGSNIAITKNDSGMAAISYTCGTWSSGTSGTVKLPTAGTYQVRYTTGCTSVLWWDGASQAHSPLVRTKEIGTCYRFYVETSGTLTLKIGSLTTQTETDSTATIYYRRIGD